MPTATMDSKKKVTFAEHPEFYLFKDSSIELTSSPQSQQSTASIMNRITNCFNLKLKGNSIEYYNICELLGKQIPDPSALDSQQLKMWISAFSQCVSSLSNSCQRMVDRIISISWIDKDSEFIDLFHRFLETLVSAHSVHTIQVCKMLIQTLSTTESLDNSSDHLKIPDRIHKVLSNILLLIPMGPLFLLPIITEYFPDKSSSGQCLNNYISNILVICEYSVELREHIWTLILEKTIQIDSEIQLEIESMDEEDWEEFQLVEFENYRETIVSDQDDEDDLDIYSDDDDISSPTQQDIRKLIKKLDDILEMLFQRIKIEIENDRTLYHILLGIFESLFLPTHHLRSTQFLIFYAASLDGGFPEDFMGLLVGKVLKIGIPTAIRVAAGSYLASFVSRAKFVGVDSVKMCLKLLVPFCINYLDQCDEIISKKSVGKHGVFYSVVQSILYIFCFRWREIMADVVGQLPSEMNGFQRVITSKLQPLKICSENIVEEFARITHLLNILYCYPFMTRENADKWRNVDETLVEEGKKNMELSVIVLDRLDTHFPFDPLLLPTSKTYVQELYQEWISEDSDDDDDQMENDELNQYLSGTSLE